MLRLAPRPGVCCAAVQPLAGQDADGLGRARVELPCHTADPELWFSEQPAALERAKVLCESCPLRRECLNGALERREPWGVWGGEIVERGAVVAHKRPRGRPRKQAHAAHIGNFFGSLSDKI